MSKEEYDIYANTFTSEPKFNCPVCDAELHTEWVDNGFGPYSVQVSPYGCESCGWHETGCEYCVREHCFSWDKCGGKAVIEKNKNMVDLFKVKYQIKDRGVLWPEKEEEVRVPPKRAVLDCLKAQLKKYRHAMDLSPTFEVEIKQRTHIGWSN